MDPIKFHVLSHHKMYRMRNKTKFFCIDFTILTTYHPLKYTFVTQKSQFSFDWKKTRPNPTTTIDQKKKIYHFCSKTIFYAFWTIQMQHKHTHPRICLRKRVLRLITTAPVDIKSNILTANNPIKWGKHKFACRTVRPTHFMLKTKTKQIIQKQNKIRTKFVETNWGRAWKICWKSGETQRKNPVDKRRYRISFCCPVKFFFFFW